jgi:drug/metabolite transporter (DMT)-like permease
MRTEQIKNTISVAWAMTGMTFYVLYNAVLKLLNTHHDAAQVLWVTSATVLALAAPWAMRQRGAAIRSTKPWLHVLRAVLNTLSALGTLYALRHLSLGEVTLYQLTTPIFLIPAALLLLGEAVRPLRWLGVLIGFGGVWIISAPDFSSGLPTAVLVVLACAISDALLGVLLKQGQNETPLALLWWTYSGKTLLLGWLTGFTLPHFNVSEWLLLLLAASLSISCMLSFITSYRTADATIAETGSFIGLLVGPLAGWLMFGETLGAHYWLGAGVLVCGLLIALFEPDWRPWLRRPAAVN